MFSDFPQVIPKKVLQQIHLGIKIYIYMLFAASMKNGQ